MKKRSTLYNARDHIRIRSIRLTWLRPHFPPELSSDQNDHSGLGPSSPLVWTDNEVMEMCHPNKWASKFHWTREAEEDVKYTLCIVRDTKAGQQKGAQRKQVVARRRRQACISNVTETRSNMYQVKRLVDARTFNEVQR